MIRRALERVLQAQIRNALGIGNEYRILLFISARSAIFSFFQSLRTSKGQVKVLGPDYVCNSVPLAIERAGGVDLRLYPLGKDLVPEEKDLACRSNELKADVLVLAPIFGAQGEGYNRLLKKLSGEKGAPIIMLDEAQFMDPLPCSIDVVVLSFHGKSVNGLNGGALVLNRGFEGCDLPPSRTIGINDEFYLFLLFLMRRKSRRERPKASGEVKSGFSVDPCEYFPGRIESARMPLVSLLVTILEMLRLEHYREVRRANFKVLSERVARTSGAHIVATENAETASHFALRADDKRSLAEVVRSLGELGITVGRPYSLYDNPDASARPELFSVENPFRRLKR